MMPTFYLLSPLVSPFKDGTFSPSNASTVLNKSSSRPFLSTLALSFDENPSHVEARFYQSMNQTNGYYVAFVVAAAIISIICFI